MEKKIRLLIFPIVITVFLFSCDDKPADNPPVLENKRRVECERRVPMCNNKDAMRFYQSMPIIYQDTVTGNLKVREVWYSFLVCCEDFQRIMDTLTAYNHIFDPTGLYMSPASRETTIGNIKISASLSFYGDWQSKAIEWLSLGDSTMTWNMPTGKYFEEHKRELEEAHKRCCLL